MHKQIAIVDLMGLPAPTTQEIAISRVYPLGAVNIYRNRNKKKQHQPHQILQLFKSINNKGVNND